MAICAACAAASRAAAACSDAAPSATRVARDSCVMPARTSTYASRSRSVPAGMGATSRAVGVL
eukprot:800766-Prymnesium_polylepis.1